MTLFEVEDTLSLVGPKTLTLDHSLLVGHYLTPLP